MLEGCPATLLLLKEADCFLLSLFNLLVEDLILAVLHVLEHLSLTLNKLLASTLLLLELLLLSVLLELIEFLLLTGVILNLALLGELLFLLAYLCLNEVLVGLAEGLLLVLHLALSFLLLLGLTG